MRLKVIGGARSVLWLALACGASACGSSRSGGLFEPNPNDGGVDADVGEDSTASTDTGSESTAGSGTSTGPGTDSTSGSGGVSSSGTPGSSEPATATDGSTAPVTDSSDLSTDNSSGSGTVIVVPTGSSDTSAPPDTSTGPVDVTTDPVDTSTLGETTSGESTSAPVPPTCVISVPSKTLLNGVAAPEGDRVNAAQLPLKTRVVVTTDLPDGADVVLSTGVGSELFAEVNEGQAAFELVELSPDGEFTLNATCSGETTSQATPVTVTVDTAAPSIGAGIVPRDGDHYPPGADEDPGTPDVLDFSVCVPVQSPDALGLGTDNVCVSLGAAGPYCAPATVGGIAPGSDGVCIPVVCPGSAPFSVGIEVTDAAGNPSTAAVAGVTCASQTPTVEIVSLTDNRTAPNDVGIRLLAAANTNPDSVLKDADDATPGAQHAVVACTNATVGSQASLLAGLEAQTLSELATATVVQAVGDECPVGLGGVVQFTTTTLPNSTVVSGAISAYTVVRVVVTDTSTEEGTSPDAYVWVDPTIPSVSVSLPSRFCEDGFLPTAGDPVVVEMNMNGGGAYPITAQIVRTSDENLMSSYSFTSSITSEEVTFLPGHYRFTATNAEASGNWGALGACDITVADLPQITWITPLVTTTALVGADGTFPDTIADDDALTEGWQGTLELTVTPPVTDPLDGMEVVFRVNGVEVGTVALVDDNGNDVTVTLPVDIADALDVTISAEIVGASDEVISELDDLVVDTQAPGAVAGLQAEVETRRETSFRLAWTPPSSGAAGYDVAYVAVNAGDNTTVIDAANFDAATSAADILGDVDTGVVGGLMIEQRYLLAVRPYDEVGNPGPVAALASPALAQFNTLVLAPPALTPGSQWGYSVDASTDLNGDGTADLVVGTKAAGMVYIYWGDIDGTYASTANVTIAGPPDTEFGRSLAVVGNVIGSSDEDIAIAAPSYNELAGRVYLIEGRETWPTFIDLSDPENPNPDENVIDFPTGGLGYPVRLARLGDFDGDGNDDFAIHAQGYGDLFQGALIVIKGDAANFPDLLTVPDDTAFFEVYVPVDEEEAFYGYDWLLGVTDVVSNRSAVLAADYTRGDQRLITRNPTALSGFDEQLLDYGDVVDPYDTEIGAYPAALLGTDTLAIQLTGARNGLGNSPGVVDLYTLSATDTFGPAPYKTLFSGSFNNNFGQILIGNRYGGRNAGYNQRFFGTDDAAPSLILGGGTYQGGLPKLYMISPTRLQALLSTSSAQELETAVDVEYLLSSVPGINPDWTDEIPDADADWHGGLGFPIRDMNGDGFADIGVTEWEDDGLGPVNYTGGIVILY